MASNLCASTRPMARAPVGNTQRRTRHRRVTTVSSTSSFRRRRRRRRGRLLGRQAAGARPRHHIRCWLRRAMRCDGAFAAAPAQHARTQRHRSVLLLRARCIRPGALCVHGRARHGVRAHLLRSASASRREAKGARPRAHRRTTANGEKYVVNRSVPRARSMRRWVAARARAGPTWVSERSSSVARARRKARGE